LHSSFAVIALLLIVSELSKQITGEVAAQPAMVGLFAKQHKGDRQRQKPNVIVQRKPTDAYGKNERQQGQEEPYDRATRRNTQCHQRESRPKLQGRIDPVQS